MSIGNDPLFLRGILYILIIAILITIFELSFYCGSIVHTENGLIYYKLNKIDFGDNINISLPEMPQMPSFPEMPSLPPMLSSSLPPMPQIQSSLPQLPSLPPMPSMPSLLSHPLNAYLNTKIARDNVSDSKINADAVTFMVLVMFILLLICLFIIYKLHILRDKHGIGLAPVLLSSFLTVIILIAFQGTMYMYGKNFKYTTNDQIKLLVIDKLNESLK